MHYTSEFMAVSSKRCEGSSCNDYQDKDKDRNENQLQWLEHTHKGKICRETDNEQWRWVKKIEH